MPSPDDRPPADDAYPPAGALPVPVRAALACFPPWWHEHYGADARSTAADAHNAGVAPWHQASGLLVSALRARVHGRKALGIEPVTTPVGPFVPTTAWRVARVVTLVVVSVEIAGAFVLAAWSGWGIWADRDLQLDWGGPAITVERFDWWDAIAWFLALLVTSALLAVALRSVARRAHPTRWSAVGCAAAMLVQVAVLVTGAIGENLASGYSVGEPSSVWDSVFDTPAITTVNGASPAAPPVMLSGWGPALLLPLAGLIAMSVLVRHWLPGRGRVFAAGAVCVAALTGIGLVGATGARQALSTFHDPWVGDGFWDSSLAAVQPLRSPAAMTCPTSSACVLEGTTPEELGELGRFTLTFADLGRAASERPTGTGWRYARTVVEVGRWALGPAVGGAAASLFAFPQGIACVGRTCLATATLGSSGLVLRTTDGGATWTTTFEPPRPQYGSGPPFQASAGPVTCASDGRCLLLATTGRASFGPYGQEGLFWSSDAGGHWTEGSVLPKAFEPDDALVASCVAGGTCWVAAGYGSPVPGLVVVVHDGRDLHTVPTPPGEATIAGWACQSAQRCDAVGYDGGAWRFDSTVDAGAHWTSHATVGSPLYGPFCATLAACWLKDRSGLWRTLDGGTTWSRATALRGWTVEAFGCSDMAHCTALATTNSQPASTAADVFVLVTDNGWRTFSRAPAPLVPTWAIPRIDVVTSAGPPAHDHG